jgi:AcrR family transcriptional regulator
MVTRAEQKNATRQAIMQAALELSAERGLSSLSLRGIAAHAGIAPTSFYRHFENVDDLSLALADEVGLSLRQLIREARRRIAESQSTSVTRASIETFMDFAENNAQLFRLLLGEGAGSTAPFRLAIHKEIARFTDDLGDDLVAAAAATGRPLANVELAAEAMVTIAFNLGAAAIDQPPAERRQVAERIITQVRMVMRGAQAEAAQASSADPSDQPGITV